MVRQLHLRTQGGHESSAAHPDVIGDRYVFEINKKRKWWKNTWTEEIYSPVHRCLGPCLALSPEYSFILEDELGVCGCVLGILDVRSFAKRCQASWIPAMRDKYPPKVGNTYTNTQVGCGMEKPLLFLFNILFIINIYLTTTRFPTGSSHDPDWDK